MLQRGTYKKGPLELAQRMAHTRQFGAARGVLHYSVGMENAPITTVTGVIQESKFQVGKVTRKDSLFVADAMTGNTSTSLFQAILYDQGKNPLADAFLPGSLLFGRNLNTGTSYFPFILDECIVTECPSPIPIKIAGGDVSIANATLHGRIIEKGAAPYDWFNKRRNRVFPYWMTAQLPNPPTAGATYPWPISLAATTGDRFEIKNGNWYFQGLKIVGQSLGGADCTYKLTDPISKQVYMNGVVSINDTAGGGSFPTLFDVPLFLKPNSRLVLEVNNPSAFTASVWLAIFGRKIYARDADEALELANAKEPS